MGETKVYPWPKPVVRFMEGPDHIILVLRGKNMRAAMRQTVRRDALRIDSLQALHGIVLNFHTESTDTYFAASVGIFSNRVLLILAGLSLVGVRMVSSLNQNVYLFLKLFKFI